MIALIAIVCFGAVRSFGRSAAFEGEGSVEDATLALSDPETVTVTQGSTQRSGGSGAGGSGSGPSGGAGSGAPVFNQITGAIQSTQLADGSFEDGEERVVGTYSAGTNVLAWTVVAGTVDSHAVEYAGFGSQDRVLDLNGRTAGAVSQDIAITPGVGYSLTFLAAENVNCGPAVKTMAVEWNGQVISNVEVDLPQGGVEEVTINLPPSASTTGTLTLRSTTLPGPQGPRNLGPTDSRCGVQVDVPSISLASR